MHELTVLDLTIIVLYMIGMLLVGVWFVKRIKNTGEMCIRDSSYIWETVPLKCSQR